MIRSIAAALAAFALLSFGARAEETKAADTASSTANTADKKADKTAKKAHKKMKKAKKDAAAKTDTTSTTAK